MDFYLSFVVLFIQIVGKLILSRTIFPSGVITLAWVLMGLTTLVAVIFSEPLKHWMEGHRPLVEGSLAIFGVQAFFEMVEKYISMFSNTLSYVRVGAFAIVHAGFTSAVFVIAQSGEWGNRSWLRILGGGRLRKPIRHWPRGLYCLHSDHASPLL